MFIIVTKYLIPKGYRGLTIFPFVILANEKDRQNQSLINHEKIHIRQQLELLLLPFFIWYFLEYLIRLVHYGRHGIAYRNISFEREAYDNDYNLDYIQKRKFWNFVNYIKSRQ